MSVPSAITIDFETHQILPRPSYPPRPTSLAIKWPDSAQVNSKWVDSNGYVLMSWGHAMDLPREVRGNNCTEREARGELLRAYRSKYPLLFQNAMFDLDVAETHWELPLPSWERVHDTMFLLALYDPHAATFSLKPSAERLLDIAPEEQDRMYDWILANVTEATPSTAGAFISRCPYGTVRPYHKGDLVRTWKLFKWLWPQVIEEMQEAYDRERKLMPILLESSREGMRMDRAGLERDLPSMRQGVERADHWLFEKIGIENVDSDRQLGQALYKAQALTGVTRTPKGQISVNKKYLTIDKFKDPKLFHVLQYRNQMATSISMFAQPWLELIDGSNVMHPNWVQVRSSRNGGDKSAGARSNRIISVKPNFLNIPKKWKRAISAGYVHPAWLRVPELPWMRRYCLPDPGEQWGKRDFNQQELRLFGHFEEGAVQHSFLTDAGFDIHEDVRAEAERRLIAARLRKEFDRDTAKTCVFGRVYGQGLRGLLETLRLSEDDKGVAKIVQQAINAAVPSINEMDKEIKELAEAGKPIYTWGGRRYYVEEPGYSEKYGRNMTYEYKLLNYLLQGSGADVTKETIIRYHEHPKREGRITVTVYDEIDFSARPGRAMRQEQTLLRDVMRSIETGVPMLSDGETGPNWGTLEKYDI
jgi:DNA polymerase I-like protein with 3'-5' exonuclease and polymerase domains